MALTAAIRQAGSSNGRYEESDIKRRRNQLFFSWNTYFIRAIKNNPYFYQNFNIGTKKDIEICMHKKFYKNSPFNDKNSPLIETGID